MNEFYRCRHGGGPFFARLFISLVFILGGIGKILAFDQSAQLLASVGVNGPIHFYLFIGILMEIVGGIMLLLGWHNRVACGILMIFLLPTTFIVHAFWSFEGPEVILQLSNFLKNVAIYGGLILLFCHGPGRWSIDTRRTCDQ